VHPRRRSAFSLLALGALGLFAPRTGAAEPTDDPDDAPEPPPPVARGVAPAKPSRPDVRLDRLEFPPGFPNGSALEHHFRRELKKAAHRADWGAGRGAKIEYRVKIEELSVREGTNVIHVRCTALGSLPKGRSTRSFIEFGGNPSERERVLEHVLAIVARGVVTRLAAIEAGRRAQAARS